jgi:hypothetical protein
VVCLRVQALIWPSPQAGLADTVALLASAGIRRLMYVDFDNRPSATP